MTQPRYFTPGERPEEGLCPYCKNKLKKPGQDFFCFPCYFVLYPAWVTWYERVTPGTGARDPLTNQRGDFEAYRKVEEHWRKLGTIHG